MGENSMEFSLSLPDEIWVNILTFTDFTTLCYFRAICTHCLSLVEERSKDIISNSRTIRDKLYLLINLWKRSHHHSQNPPIENYIFESPHINSLKEFRATYIEYGDPRRLYFQPKWCLSCRCKLFLRFCAFYTNGFDIIAGDFIDDVEIYCQDCYLRAVTAYYREYKQFPDYNNLYFTVANRNDLVPDIDTIPGLEQELHDALCR